MLQRPLAAAERDRPCPIPIIPRLPDPLSRRLAIGALPGSLRSAQDPCYATPFRKATASTACRGYAPASGVDGVSTTRLPGPVYFVGAPTCARLGRFVTRGDRNRHPSTRGTRRLARPGSANIPKTQGPVGRLDLYFVDDDPKFALPRRSSTKHLVSLAIIIRCLRAREILRTSQVGIVEQHFGGHLSPSRIKQSVGLLDLSPTPCKSMPVGRCSNLPALHGSVRGGPARTRNPNDSNRSAVPDGLSEYPFRSPRAVLNIGWPIPVSRQVAPAADEARTQHV